MTISIIVDTVLTETPMAGYPFRVLELVRGYSRKGVNVQLILCNRNFTSIKDLSWLGRLGHNVKTLLINPYYFYKKAFLNKLLSIYGADVIQFENPEFVLNSDRFIIENFDKTIFVLELHDLYYKLTDKNRMYNLFDKALRLVDYVVCFTKKDARILNKDFRKIKCKIFYSPIFIDYNNYPFYGPNLKGNNILFMGNLYHGPNMKTARFLKEKVCPFVGAKIRDFHIHFIGMCPKKFLREKSSSCTFYGFVKKRSQILRKIKLCVAPVFEGYGTRVKILEYASFGFPVLTTKKGVSGLEKLKGLFIADIARFTDKLVEILSQERLLLRAGLANRLSVRQNYDEFKIVSLLLSKITKKRKHKTQLQIRLSKRVYFPFWLKEGRCKKGILKGNYFINKNEIKKLKI